MKPAIVGCQTCGPARYCAPNRCYCGHAECHAYASWTARKGQPAATTTRPNRSRAAELWATREEPTWLDK